MKGAPEGKLEIINLTRVFCFHNWSTPDVMLAEDVYEFHTVTGHG